MKQIPFCHKTNFVQTLTYGLVVYLTKNQTPLKFIRRYFKKQLSNKETEL